MNNRWLDLNRLVVHRPTRIIWTHEIYKDVVGQELLQALPNGLYDLHYVIGPEKKLQMFEDNNISEFLIINQN